MAKMRKQFILDSAKIVRVKRILGASTDTEAVDEALNIVVADADISSVHTKLAGRCNIKDMDQSKFRHVRPRMRYCSPPIAKTSK